MVLTIFFNIICQVCVRVVCRICGARRIYRNGGSFLISTIFGNRSFVRAYPRSPTLGIPVQWGGGARSGQFLPPYQLHHILHVDGMGKHIDRLDGNDIILLTQYFQIACLCRGIATDIHDPLRIRF